MQLSALKMAKYRKEHVTATTTRIVIYTYRDIYAWKVAGACSIIAHIQAEGAYSSIASISTDINSPYPKLHADK